MTHTHNRTNNDVDAHEVEKLYVGTGKWSQVLLMHHGPCKAPLFENKSPLQNVWAEWVVRPPCLEG